MINIKRVAREIKDVGLYDLILQDVQKIAGKKKLSTEEILKIMDENPQILDEYKQVNTEYNLSNIHIENIKTKELENRHHKKAEKINKNLEKIKEIEKYTLEFEHSSVLVIIFSIEFFVLFSVQYFIVLLDLKEWQLWIYSLFASSIAIAWIYAKKQQKIYKENAKKFYKLYDETKKLIDELENEKVICREDIYQDANEEHI